jgi:hypothetical protein
MVDKGEGVMEEYSQKELIEKIKWMIHLRWRALAVIVLIVLFFRFVRGVTFDLTAFIITAITLVIYNVIFQLLTRRKVLKRGRLVLIFALWRALSPSTRSGA